MCARIKVNTCWLYSIAHVKIRKFRDQKLRSLLITSFYWDDKFLCTFYYSLSPGFRILMWMLFKVISKASSPQVDWWPHRNPKLNFLRFTWQRCRLYFPPNLCTSHHTKALLSLRTLAILHTFSFFIEKKINKQNFIAYLVYTFYSSINKLVTRS